MGRDFIKQNAAWKLNLRAQACNETTLTGCIDDVNVNCGIFTISVKKRGWRMNQSTCYWLKLYVKLSLPPVMMTCKLWRIDSFSKEYAAWQKNQLSLPAVLMMRELWTIHNSRKENAAWPIIELTNYAWQHIKPKLNFCISDVWIKSDLQFSKENTAWPANQLTSNSSSVTSDLSVLGCGRVAKNSATCAIFSDTTATLLHQETMR